MVSDKGSNLVRLFKEFLPDDEMDHLSEIYNIDVEIYILNQDIDMVVRVCEDYYVRVYV